MHLYGFIFSHVSVYFQDISFEVSLLRAYLTKRDGEL